MANETDTTAFNQGLTEVAQPGLQKAEIDCAKRWLRKIAEAQEFDKPARERYARDRRFARSARGEFSVVMPVAASNIDVLSSFLYAKDPDISITPAPGTNPPPMSALLDMVREKIDADPMMQAQIQQAAQAAGAEAAQKALAAGIGAAVAGAPPPGTAAGQPPAPKPGQAPPPPAPPSPQEAAQHAANDTRNQMAQQQADELMEPHKQRASDAKRFAQTLQVVLPQMWQQAKLKPEAKKASRSWLTVGIGWLKATWQERTATDPVMEAKVNDLQKMLAGIESKRREIAEGDCADLDAEKAELEIQMQGAQQAMTIMVARGMAIDFVAAEDIQCPIGIPSLDGYLQAPWLAHRTFLDHEEAEATFPDVSPERLKKATKYRRKKQDATAGRDQIGAAANVPASEADAYETGTWAEGGDPGDWSVCVYEVWDKTANSVITLIEGMEGCAKQPYSPNPPTKRFYPFFQVAPLQVDGARHPQSFIERTETLLMEMNRIPSAKRVHRIRTKPKTIIDATGIDPEQLKKISGGDTQEIIPVKPLRPGENVALMIAPIQYAQIDPALYDTSDIRAGLEAAWGIQEALASSIQTAKTATEADIQDKGSSARTAFMKDAQDEMLNDLAEYTAQVAVQKLTLDDVKSLAGPFSFWPPGLTVQNLESLVSVKIKAGSSGKPNTSSERAAWGVIAPMLQNLIQQVAALRSAAPEDVADCLEELARETLSRMGESMDVDEFLPQAPSIAPPISAPPTPGPGGMPMPGAAMDGGMPPGPGAPAPAGDLASAMNSTAPAIGPPPTLQ